MRPVKLNVTLSAAILMTLALSGFATSSMATHVERIIGIVQDWSLEQGYVLVDGVRHQTSDDVYLVDETGLSIDFSRLKVGTRVSLLENDGVVQEIALIREEQ